MTAYLFIGGSRDGQWCDVEHGQRDHYVLRRKPLPLEPIPHDKDRPYSISTVEREPYTRRIYTAWRGGEETGTTELFASAEMSDHDVMNALVRLYRPTDLADDAVKRIKNLLDRFDLSGPEKGDYAELDYVERQLSRAIVAQRNRAVSKWVSRIFQRWRSATSAEFICFGGSERVW